MRLLLLIFFPLCGFSQADTVQVDTLFDPITGIIGCPEAPSDSINCVLDYADSEPQFPGGEAAMMKFISENLVWPLHEACGQGIIYVSFVVAKDGQVSDVKCLKGVGSACDEAAMDVIRKMPNWIPGEDDGRKVNVRFTIPIRIHSY